MRARILLKSAASLLAVAAIALVSTDYLTSLVVEKIYVSDHERELESVARIVAGADIDARQLRGIAAAAKARITLIGNDGRVIADSSLSSVTDEARQDRPEVRDALAGKVGRSIRPSSSQGERYLYVAVPVSQGVLRISTPYAAVDREVAAIRARVLESTALGFLPAILIALFLAQKISLRLGSIIGFAGELANGNFHSRLPEHRSGELALLGRKLNETSAKLERTVQQLQTEHTELEKLERIRKDFVINVSHELRTPLASIQGYAETLIDGAIHDEANNMRFLGIIRHNAERLALLTSDLLSLSRIEMKTQKFRFAFYRVNELLREVLEMIRPIADKKEIELMQELAPAGTEVFCDSEAVYQILSNLVDNAVKYTPEHGKITVGLSLLPPATGPQMLEIFVRDTGIGIPPEDQPRLFERFYRVDKARSRELGGTGLGLAIVKHLVRTHGGDVRVESALHRGSTFFFTLPLEESNEMSGRPDPVASTATLA